MPFLPVPDGALAVVSYVKGTESFSNSFWFRFPDFTYTDQEALAAVMDAEWATRWRNNAHSACSYVHTTVYDMRSEAAPIVVANANQGPGVGTGEVLPINVALVVSLYTGARGKTGRGRHYLSGFSEGHLANGNFTASLKATVLSWYASWRALVDATNWAWCVCSKYEGGVPRAEGLLRVVTDYQIRSLIPGSQRRRLDRP